MSNSNIQSKKTSVSKGGRPAGSGEQLAPSARSRKSRRMRAEAGAARLDVTLSPLVAQALETLIAHWECKSRKEAIERAISIAASTISK